MSKTKIHIDIDTVRWLQGMPTEQALGGIMDMLLRAYADGVEDVQPKWINTKDEQPRDGETVLVLYRTQVIAAQHNLNSSNESCWTLWTCPGSVNSETSRSTITLWMRLPPMPIRRGEE